MIFKARSLLVLASMLLFGTAAAQAQTLEKKLLVDILSEPENNLHHQLILHLNEVGDVEQIGRVSVQSEQIFTLDDLLTKEVVLATSSGLDAVLLSCKSCDPLVGGDMNLRYIYNGINKNYRNFSMHIHRDGKNWTLSTMDGVVIQTLTLKARKILGAVVGIKEIGLNEYPLPTLFYDQISSFEENQWIEAIPADLAF